MRERTPGQKPYVQVPPRPPIPPLGDLVEEVSRDGLKAPENIKSAKITDLEFLASYNWADSGAKVIIPGKPSKWTPLPKPKYLSRDSGIYYRDINSASFPTHPLEPAILSIMKMRPDHPVPANIVACGSTIGSLLRFANATRMERKFRMLVEVVGDTVHFIRRENTPTEIILNVKGFGHSFPEAYTTWDEETKGSSSHQRIIRYKFGGLDMMVRFEGDGFIDSSPQTERPRVPASTQNHTTLPDNLLGLVIEKPIIEAHDAKVKFEIVNGGEIVSQKDIFDLKTRSVAHCRHKDNLGEQLPRLWISQTQQFILAFHERCVFRDIRIDNVADDVGRWEESNQAGLMRLAGLLHLIVDRACKAPDGKLEVIVNHDSSTLEIRKQAPGSGDVLSAPVRKEWMAWLHRATLLELGSDDGELDGPILPAGVDDACEDHHSDHSSYGFGDGFDQERDYTACDKECEYCGHCGY